MGGGGGFGNMASEEKYDFTWNPELSELENVYNLDIVSTKALFRQPKMSFDLKKG